MSLWLFLWFTLGFAILCLAAYGGYVLIVPPKCYLGIGALL